MDPRFPRPEPFLPGGRPRLFEGPFARGDLVHQGPPTLAWVIFALLLVLLLATFANLALALAGRGGMRRPAFARRARWRIAPAGGAGADAPLAILRTRYARGEISRDEFILASDDLGGREAPPAEETTEERPPER